MELELGDKESPELGATLPLGASSKSKNSQEELNRHPGLREQNLKCEDHQEGKAC